jgi:hypothetical protein
LSSFNSRELDELEGVSRVDSVSVSGVLMGIPEWPDGRGGRDEKNAKGWRR